MLRKILVVVGLVSLSGLASAADVSLISGVLQTEKAKSEGKNLGSQTHVSAGGRFEDSLSTEMNWFAQGGLGLHSYSAGSGLKSPDDGVTVSLGGGVRWYFTPFATGIVPFLAGLGEVKTDEEVDYNSTGYSKKEVSGLYYSGLCGLRVAMNTRFFLELELPIFRSPLFETTKTESDNGTATTKSEQTRMDLYVNSREPITSIQVNVGMKL